jgi:hypothetical protein
MTRLIAFAAAAGLGLSPALATAPGNGPVNGTGWNHLNSPNSATTGQPSQSCGSADALFTPGGATDARGSAFNPDGVAGMHYAGQQVQNSRNTTAAAQYDVACSNQKTP